MSVLRKEVQRLQNYIIQSRFTKMKRNNKLLILLSRLELLEALLVLTSVTSHANI